MSGTTKVTSTQTLGWQDICRKWAKAGEAFEIHGVSPRHLTFCKDLCVEFNYECSYQSHHEDSPAVFLPAA